MPVATTIGQAHTQSDIKSKKRREKTHGGTAVRNELPEIVTIALVYEVCLTCALI